MKDSRRQHEIDYDTGWTARADGEAFESSKSKSWRDGWLKRLVTNPNQPIYTRNDFNSDEEWETFKECLTLNSKELWKLFARKHYDKSNF